MPDLEEDEAVAWYERQVADAPDDADAWRDLADALVSTGDDAGGTRALRRFLELVPGDVVAMADLAHLEHRAGRSTEAVELVHQALERSPGNGPLLRDLVDLHLARGQTESALARAEELLEADPDNLSALLDVAELALQMGDRAKAVRTFELIATHDDTEGHRVYAHHGIVAAEIAEERWRPAMNSAIDASAVDRHQLTTDLLVFVTAQVFGPDQRHRPRPWPELEQDLTAERALHRRFHAEQSIG